MLEPVLRQSQVIDAEPARAGEKKPKENDEIEHFGKI
jgi:hypothetical protein